MYFLRDHQFYILLFLYLLYVTCILQKFTLQKLDFKSHLCFKFYLLKINSYDAILKIHAQFSEELFCLYLVIQVKNFNAYFIDNFVAILCSFFKYMNKEIKLFILSYFDLMSNCTNQKREGSNIVLNQNGVWMSHKLTQIHKTNHAFNLEKINIVLTIIWYILCNFLNTTFPRTLRCC